eukprot:6181591-Pleurochrysis_carterae.AAC.1
MPGPCKLLKHSGWLSIPSWNASLSLLDGWVGGPDAVTPPLRDEAPDRRALPLSLRPQPSPLRSAPWLRRKGGVGWGEHCARSLARWLRHRARSFARVRGYVAYCTQVSMFFLSQLRGSLPRLCLDDYAGCIY